MSESYWMELYNKFSEMDKTRKNLLKRAVEPEDLLENPVFYELYKRQNKNAAQRSQFLRLVYCLPFLKHKNGGRTLGQVFAQKEKNQPIVSESRIIQLSRTDDNKKNMVQLRRLLKQVQSKLKEGCITVDWNKFGKKLIFWNKKARRDILEDYFLSL